MLYKKHGLDLDDLMDKISVMKALRKEIRGIADEYDVKWEDAENEREHDRHERREGEDDLEQEVSGQASNKSEEADLRGERADKDHSRHRS